VAGFRLGFRIDPKSGKAGADALTIESSDLATHGAILGMTGSGKTCLAVVLLEDPGRGAADRREMEGDGGRDRLRPEASDVHVAQLALVWVPTA
jgi:Helicase HerA, central domain